MIEWTQKSKNAITIKSGKARAREITIAFSYVQDIQITNFLGFDKKRVTTIHITMRGGMITDFSSKNGDPESLTEIYEIIKDGMHQVDTNQ